MPKVKYGPDIVSIAGSLFEQTYDKCRTGGTFIRQRRRTKYDERPASKTLIRNRVGLASKEWKIKLTDAERTAWNSNRGRFPNGYTYYIAVCANLASAGFTSFPTVPPDTSKSPTSVDIRVIYINGALKMVQFYWWLPDTYQAGARVRVWAKTEKTLYQRQLIATGLVSAKHLNVPFIPKPGRMAWKWVQGMESLFEIEVVNPDGTVSPLTTKQKQTIKPNLDPWDDMPWDNCTWG